jgi:hypothetical protein
MAPSRPFAYVFALILLSASYPSPAEPPPPAPKPGDQTIEIDFTGKLFGYYRVRAGSKKPFLPPVATFFPAIKEESDQTVMKPANSLLLGMGDNFAPEFGARLQEKGTTGCVPPFAKQSSPEKFFKGADRLVTDAKCDAVANFLEKAGYRALVPGREDFLYGAVWLRNIGDLLSRDKTTASIDHRTIMLGANLRILEDKPPKKGGLSLASCGLLFGEYSSAPGKYRCSTKGYDLASGTSIVPEKFRLLRKLDSWIEEPERYRNWTEITSETLTVSADDKSVTVKDKSKLLDKTTRRQLLLRDLIETLTLSLPFCPLYKPGESEGTVSELQSDLQKLVRDYKPGELVAMGTDWGKAENHLSPAGGKTVGELCGWEARDDAEKAEGVQFASSVSNFAVGLRATLEKEESLETRIQNGFRGKEPVTAPSAESHDTSEKNVVERGILTPEPTTLLKSARTALLLAIAKEQREVGFTVAKVKSPDGQKEFEILVVGVVGVETMQSVQNSNLALALCPVEKGSSQYGICKGNDQPAPADEMKFKVSVTDPVETVEAVVRAASVGRSQKYDLTVLMAQMPHTEAEELVSRVRSHFMRPSIDEPEKEVETGVDIAISEAQQDHATANITLNYDVLNYVRNSDSEKEKPPVTVPVLTPRPAYDTMTESLVQPTMQATVTLSEVCVTSKPHTPSGSGECTKEAKISNIGVASKPDIDVEAASAALKPTDGSGSGPNSALTLLVEELPDSRTYPLTGLGAGAFMGTTCIPGTLYPKPDEEDVSPAAKKARHDTAVILEECQLETMHAVLAVLASRGGADVAMLERRDLWMGKLPSLYDLYEACDRDDETLLNPKAYDRTKTDSGCRLRVALARVLWQDDQSAKLMVSGKDLANVLQKAQSFSDNKSALTTTDIAGQYLQTEGIVSPISGAAALSPGGFSVQSSADCRDPEEEDKPSAGGSHMYCVNGVPLQADHGYWVITSSHLASDKSEYGLSGSNPDDYKATAKKKKESLVDVAVSTSNSPVPQPPDLRSAELNQQQAKIFHVDQGKIVAGYNFQGPTGGSANIINRFQGVSDATASSAGSANLDLEQKERTTWEYKFLSAGVQNDFEFDRQVQDNLTGKFVNGNFTKNMLSAGPLLQLEVPIRFRALQKGEGRFKFHPFAKAVPRWLLVLAPAQYQTQITGSHLNFSANSGQGQVSYVAHRATGLGERIGIRREYDGGKWYPLKSSYFEFGGQFVQQRQVLAGLTFTIPGMAPIVCPANGAQSFASCAPSPKVLTDASTISGQYASTNQYGWYWDIHIQKGLFGKMYDKSTYRTTLTLDSKGDFFKNRGANNAFSTQTWFDAPASIALVFPVFRNVGFAPTYTAYFYGNQIAQDYLLVNTFSVNLRWYLDRDSRVPTRPAVVFKGPASADETQPAKTK